jgi:hypothetical protein
MNIDEEWDLFIKNKGENIFQDEIVSNIKKDCPNPTPLYISTNTKMALLNKHIDLISLFMNISIIPYYCQQNGFIKKVMQIKFEKEEDFEDIKNKLSIYSYSKMEVMIKIQKTKGRIVSKDIRKISIGLCEKNFIKKGKKKKKINAFLNCFVLIYRRFYQKENKFKEYHIKIYNSGKISIVNAQNNDIYLSILESILHQFQSHLQLTYTHSILENIIDMKTIFINSDFSCEYLINRNKFLKILQNKYHIISSYNECSNYQGIQCIFYYQVENKDDDIIIIQKNGKIENKIKNHCVHFKIFRTGSISINGNIKESVLYKIYDLLIDILKTEYNDIYY